MAVSFGNQGMTGPHHSEDFTTNVHYGGKVGFFSLGAASLAKLN
tara:strand:+ start:114 stop:245 length:132 start_codon:yes stop_codon:yes gene_type:complete